MRAFGYAALPPQRRSGLLGPLPCGCVRQQLELTARFRSQWSTLPASVMCAQSNAPLFTLAALLDGDNPAYEWVSMSIHFDLNARVYKFSVNETFVNGDPIIDETFGARLLPRHQCVSSCDNLGWCMTSPASAMVVNAARAREARAAWKFHTADSHPPPSSSAGGGGICRCFPEAVPTKQGSCTRVQYAESPDGAAAAAAKAKAHDDPPRAHASLEWGIRVGEPMLGKAVDGIRSLPLSEPSSHSVSFNFMRCPLNCSGRGICDLHGFCECDQGYWGLDCGITYNKHRKPIAWRFAKEQDATYQSPRIYVYDLDVAWRTGPQLLSEYDLALTERLLLSPYREADPSKADYFWMAGPNLSPKSKLKHVRMRWPYWNETVAKSLGARHILTTLGERGIGDSDLRPSLPSSSHAFKLLQQLVDPVSDAEMHPASHKRAWMVLSLNGMSDFKSEYSGATTIAATTSRLPPCHVCFRAGVDIVIPPPAATIDVPPCNELKTITSEAAAAGGVTTRDTLFFWAGRVVPGAHHANPMYEKAPNPRELLMTIQGEPGFKIVNTFPDRHNNKNASSRSGRRLQNGEVQPAGYVNKVEWMRRSVFCWAPPGQRYGDARRHILSAFLGCIPVLTLPDGHHTLEEILPWNEMAIHVPPERLKELPSILRAVPQKEIERMRRKLKCAQKYLWYASVYGECAPGLGGGAPDAFDALMRVLAARLRKERGLPVC